MVNGTMEEDTEYLKQSLEDRLVHKLWKARVHGYEEATKLFRAADDDRELSKFLGLVKKFVSDSNAAAQERGLEAALAFAESYQHAGKNVGEVMPCLVNKCISAAKPRTRELSVSLVLMYVELEKGEQVVEELLKGTDHKNPKTQAACIAAITQALREFGNRAIGVKPLMGKLATLLEHRDKGVRDEAKSLAVEIHRWVGAVIRAQLAANCKAVQMAELDAEFEKVKGEKPTASRLLRSQQKKEEKAALDMAAAGEPQDCEQTEAEEEADPMDLLEPVDVLAALPKDTMERLEAKKWQDRKEALDQLEGALAAPKIAAGDFGDLVRALKKMVSKDANVVVVASATRCLGALARGLGKRFAPYAGACIGPLLDKFKEKKPAVVTALREAVDAALVSTSVEAIQEDVVAALDSKNPQVKTETASFLARAFTHCTAAVLNKKLLKGYVVPLVKLLADPDPAVRDAAAEALGTALRVVGEKAMAPLWQDLDAAKQTKIRDCSEKAVIVAKASRPASAPAKMAAPKAELQPVVRRPATAAVAGKKPVARKPAAAAATTAAAKPRPVELSAEELEERAALIFSAETLAGLSDTSWKTRLASVESLTQTLATLEDDARDANVLLAALGRKPGLRDTNFQVLRARLDAVKLIAESVPMETASVEGAVKDIALALGDAKNGAAAAEALTALANATALGSVAQAALDAAFAQKSPKVQVEALAWLTAALDDFGCSLDPRTALECAKRAVDAINPAVRAAGVALAGALHVHLGPQVALFFEGEKPQVLATLQAEFDKRAGEVPVAPTRGAVGGQEVNVRDLMPHTDISAAIDDKLVSELKDKNWKVRMEALQRVSVLVTGKLVGPALGELPALLCQRLADSNAKIAASALQICTALAGAMGPDGKRHLRTFFPALVLGLGDSKAWIREAALACLAAWEASAGVKEFFAGGEMTAAALDAGSPQLRAELCAWLASALDKLPVGGAPKDELASLISPVLATLDDRSPDVRKSGNAALVPLMSHVGYQSMLRVAEKLKPATRPAVVVLLDKARGSLPLPADPPASAASAANRMAGGATMTRPKTANAAASAAAKKVGVGNAPAARPGSRKREEEDSTPALQRNTMKNQRCIDEQKLKVLKWNFATPRDEFVELLRDQLTAAGASKTLVTNMFHSDFKYHLKAIDQLSECLATDEAATQANLDLVLKWMTLRFFDTNPSVLLRGLEYLQAVFDMLWHKEYHLFETEASSFLPYLIVKVGDPKDAVRNGVRALVKLVDLTYPRTKLFQYLLDGIKSKNARQRTECLDLLGYLIERYGLSVCGTGSPAAALREIARQISDRDNSVRNAALNCVVHAWHIEGDRAIKMLGQVGDKEMSLLEERIKRAGKKPPPPKAAGPTRSAPAPTPDREEEEEEEGEELEEEEGEEPELPQPVVNRTAVVKPRPAPGPFGLDSRFLDQLEADSDGPLRAPPLHEFDLDEFRIDAPLLGAPPPSNAKHSFPTLSPPRPLGRYEPDRPSHDRLAADRLVSGVSASDLRSAVLAMNQLDAVLQTDGAVALAGKVDTLLCASVAQLRQLRAAPPSPLVGKAYRTLLMVLMSLYKAPALAAQAGKCSLRTLLEQLLRLLSEDGLSELEGHQQLTRVVNMLVVRIIDRSEHTQLLCALISLLDESVTAGSERHQELVMKCIWKVVKLLPQWDSSLEFNVVLHDVHTFFKEHPGGWWRRRGPGQDLPLRTVKTVLHSLVKLRGAAIMTELDLVDDASGSELAAYLDKLVKAVKVQEPQRGSGQVEVPQHRLSKSTHEQLSEIFKKIGSKDRTQDGLSDLYDFKQAHPEADIEPFLAKSSLFFQRYIEEGMRTIATQRTVAPSLSSDGDEQCPQASYYLSRLRSLQQQAGLETEPTELQGDSADQNNRLNEDKQELSSILRPSSITAATNLDQLRLRLDLVKGNRLS